MKVMRNATDFLPQTHFVHLLAALDCPERDRNSLAKELTEAVYRSAASNLCTKFPSLEKIDLNQLSDKLVDALITTCGMAAVVTAVLDAARDATKRLVQTLIPQMDDRQKATLIRYLVKHQEPT